MSEHVSQEQMRKLLELPEQFSSADQAIFDEHLLVCPNCLAAWETLLEDKDVQHWRLLQQIPLLEPMPFSLPATFPAEIADHSFPLVPGYEIIGELGRGTMGVVYKARQTSADRLVALKMILAGSRAAHTIARFRTEVETLARLQVPNIVQVFEVGEYDGHPFFSFEYCAGGSLEGQLAVQPLSAVKAARLVQTLARAMHKAHQKSVVHRDLKPANILLAEDGVPKIGDFGLARKLDVSGQTHDGAILGTPSFMAPEQVKGQIKEHGPSVDIYSLGAVLYQCVTGRPPFRAATPVETLSLVLHTDPVLPRVIKRGFPRDLETICLKCLRKEPQKRYGSALELAEDLGRFLEHEPIKARPVGLPERGVKWLRRRPAAQVSILLIMVTIGALAFGSDLWRRVQESRKKAAENAESRRIAEEANQISFKYFAAMTRRHGVPEGIGPLTETEARGREATFQFKFRGDKVERVQRVNCQGSPRDPDAIPNLLRPIANDETVSEVAYQLWYDHGRLEREEALGLGDTVLWSLRYSSPERAGVRFSLSGTGEPAHGPELFRLKWSPDGFIEEVCSIDEEGRPVSTSEANCLRFENDSRGLPTRLINILINSREGTEAVARVLAIEERNYNAEGRSVGTAWLNGKGQASLKDGYHRLVIKETGMDREIACHDLEDRLTTRTDLGWSICRRKYTDQGATCEETYFDASGKGTVLKVSKMHCWTASYDSIGRELEWRALGLDRRPVRFPDKDGYVRRTTTYDAHGRVKQTEYWLCNNMDQLVIWKREDANQNILEEWAFTADGAPTLFPEGGYHHYTSVYHDRDQREEVGFFDLYGNATLHEDDGYHRSKTRYEGDKVEESYYGVDGSRVTNRKEGSHRWIDEYEKGLLKSVNHFGVNDIPVNGKDGYARRVNIYNREQKLLESVYWKADPQGKLHLWTRENVAGKTSLVLEYNFFTVDGVPTVDPDGKHHGWKAKYDDSGNATERAFFDLHGDKTLQNDFGIHRWTARYDKRNLVETASYDIDGKPANDLKQGHARSSHVYNDKGVLQETAYWKADPKGNLRLWKREDGKTRKDGTIRILEECSFSAKGVPSLFDKGGYHRYTQTWDETDHVLETAVFGLNEGEKVLRQDYGCHRWTALYDRDRPLQTNYFGVNDKPRNAKDGYARVCCQYDNKERLEETTYWKADLEGELHLWKREDAKRQLLLEASFTNEGKPSLFDKGGHHYYTQKWDEAGHVTETAFFGPKEGQKVLRADSGTHRWEARFDEWGNHVASAHYGVNNEAVAHLELGGHRWTAKFEKDHLLELSLFTVNDKSVNYKDGYARMCKLYDGQGVLQETAYWKADPNGKLHLWKRIDSKNRPLEVASFNSKGEPTLNSAGYYRVTYHYEGDSKTGEKRYFDLEGKSAPIPKMSDK